MLASDPEGASVGSTKRRTLEDLFRPPLDLLFRGSMDAAREQGIRLNRWLMINVQNVQEFSCQVLNRDVWSNPAVKDIITQHFVFWQVYQDTTEGQRYMQFYNVSEFPYVAILDPRTGEKLRSWTTIDSVTFCDLVTEFLMEHPSPSGATAAETAALNAAATSTASASVSNHSNDQLNQRLIYEESEEQQLKAAIAASLKEAASSSNHVNNKIIGDDECPDSDDLETFDSDTEDSTVAKPQLETKPKTVAEPMATEPCFEDKADTEDSAEDYRKYMGTVGGPSSDIILRFPDGKKEQISFPADSKLKALFLFISGRGYSLMEYDLVTNFPRRNVHEFDSESSLEAVGLFPRETVFIQHKS
jgi:hypothetical protein